MSQLTGQKKQKELSDFIKKLRKQADISIKLQRHRVKVQVDDDDPSKGPKSAPILLVEFSEFQCPFCKRTRPTLDKILNKYGSKVRYIFRDFPLSFHKQAKSAANAANCAQEQGKYWEFFEQLWKSQGKHSNEKLIEIGQGIGLSMSPFKACVESEKYFSEIDKDQKAGSEMGVTGTPAYFVNGVFLSGAQPYERFEEIIEEELAK